MSDCIKKDTTTTTRIVNGKKHRLRWPRAVWYDTHGSLPDCRVTTNCDTRDCANPEHLLLSTDRKPAGPSRNDYGELPMLTKNKGEFLRLRLDVIRESGLMVPKTRADCANVPRPCPFAFCRHNLRRVFDGSESGDHKSRENRNCGTGCSLDYADKGKTGTGEVARLMGLSKQSAISIEKRAMEKLEAALEGIISKEDALESHWRCRDEYE